MLEGKYHHDHLSPNQCLKWDLALHLREVFKSQNLPLPLTLDHLSASECLCVFQDVQDAQIASGALEGHPRLGLRMATVAEIRQKAFNRFKQPPKEEFMRLRINGEPLDVRKAKKMAARRAIYILPLQEGPKRASPASF